MKLLIFSTYSVKYIWYSPQKSKYILYLFRGFGIVLFRISKRFDKTLQRIFLQPLGNLSVTFVQPNLGYSVSVFELDTSHVSSLLCVEVCRVFQRNLLKFETDLWYVPPLQVSLS